MQLCYQHLLHILDIFVSKSNLNMILKYRARLSTYFVQHIKVDKSSICSFFIFKHRMPCTEYWTTRYMYMYCKYLFLCCSCFSALWASVKGLNSGQRASNCLTNSTIAVVCDMSPRACQACLFNRAELSLIYWWDKVKSIVLKNIIISNSNEKTFFLFLFFSFTVSSNFG